MPRRKLQEARARRYSAIIIPRRQIEPLAGMRIWNVAFVHMNGEESLLGE